MKKVLFFDVETGGLDPDINPIMSMAWILEVDGYIRTRKQFLINPDRGMISLQALAVNDLTIPVKDGVSEMSAIVELVKDLNGVNAQDNKVFPCAYNGNFDVSFMIKAFECRSSNWFWYMRSELIDPLALIRYRKFLCGEPNITSLTLESVASYFKIPHTPHDVMSDVDALREVFNFIRDDRNGRNE